MSRMNRLSGLFSPRTASQKASFQILSDLHLHHDAQYLTFHIPVSAPYLILAGNIGRLADYDSYLSFLIRRSDLYERIYLVLGSLEFHGLTIPQGLDLARRMEQEPGVRGKLVVLDKERIHVPGTAVVILGCTLWSQIPDNAEETALKKVPEFDREQGIRDWDVASHNWQHGIDLAWLMHQVQSQYCFARTRSSATTPTHLLVVTSFAPELSHTLSPWQVDSPWSSAYGTELLKGIDWTGVKMWICGATGRTATFKKSGVKVVMNQRGCVGEEEKGILRDGMREKERKESFDVLRFISI
ncbi:hypothetical protein K504DRAFT_460226 [Pleomassaria siparia CBS 279.74]|uniref:Ser/Thr protein phosphatase superfamily n=1 Tax=Pleomassaria siparia CBS 279.74 TaxID=1314801 RepID=A0A6G1JXY7_9PLEO|nr:hypothetical protein K504DRAFT_460226 [Pleomassaria siparia CBS 279.74]